MSSEAKRGEPDGCAADCAADCAIACAAGCVDENNGRNTRGRFVGEIDSLEEEVWGRWDEWRKDRWSEFAVDQVRKHCQLNEDILKHFPGVVDMLAQKVSTILEEFYQSPHLPSTTVNCVYHSTTWNLRLSHGSSGQCFACTGGVQDQGLEWRFRLRTHPWTALSAFWSSSHVTEILKWIQGGTARANNAATNAIAPAPRWQADGDDSSGDDSGGEETAAGAGAMRETLVQELNQVYVDLMFEDETGYIASVHLPIVRRIVGRWISIKDIVNIILRDYYLDPAFEFARHVYVTKFLSVLNDSAKLCHRRGRALHLFYCSVGAPNLQDPLQLVEDREQYLARLTEVLRPLQTHLKVKSALMESDPDDWLCLEVTNWIHGKDGNNNKSVAYPCDIRDSKTAYDYFAADRKKEIKKMHPHANPNAISRLVTAEWPVFRGTDAMKIYEQKEADDRKRYLRENTWMQLLVIDIRAIVTILDPLWIPMGKFLDILRLAKWIIKRFHLPDLTPKQTTITSIREDHMSYL